MRLGPTKLRTHTQEDSATRTSPSGHDSRRGPAARRWSGSRSTSWKTLGALGGLSPRRHVGAVRRVRLSQTAPVSGGSAAASALRAPAPACSAWLRRFPCVCSRQPACLALLARMSAAASGLSVARISSMALRPSPRRWERAVRLRCVTVRPTGRAGGGHRRCRSDAPRPRFPALGRWSRAAPRPLRGPATCAGRSGPKSTRTTTCGPSRPRTDQGEAGAPCPPD